MNLLKAIDDALKTVISWIGIVYSELCDSLGISEWSILFACIAIILILIGKKRR